MGIEKEIERKFIVNNSDNMALKTVNIYQGYIVIEDDYEERIRRVDHNGKTQYLKTKKYNTDNPLVRLEEEVEINKEEFIRLKSSVIKELSKTRSYYKTNDGQEYTIDSYSDGLDLLEIELSNINEKFSFPESINIIKEVTDLDEYKNQNIAQEI